MFHAPTGLKVEAVDTVLTNIKVKTICFYLSIWSA